ncbi:hypothetical protein NUW54_g96 [Trametes sanguinea]|uniref:Uncharacterized protein n=1 Tax=Trametes sanguinea TaxID=158606 RepID=A0ACC1QAD8_9APHY|nr:hypothetical protein NUW54_g96 [Trametes sanguinea]
MPQQRQGLHCANISHLVLMICYSSAHKALWIVHQVSAKPCSQHIRAAQRLNMANALFRFRCLPATTPPLHILLLLTIIFAHLASGLRLESLSPAARRYRQHLQLAPRDQYPSRSRPSRIRHGDTQPVSSKISIAPAILPRRQAISSNIGAHGLQSRQVEDESCNNITITPPGFDGSCSVAQPCPNGACCGPSGFCGYGNNYCGDGCTSNCDAVAECGPDAAPGHQQCPLNVCCSQFGFCGSTDEFCGTNCIGSHCGTPSIPTDINSPVTSRIVGYYEGWASSRPCDQWFPDNIPSAGYTHLNYAFASIDPTTFEVIPASASDVPQYTAFTNLKQSNPNLKTYISIGGWSFNDPPTQHVFSDMSASPANRQAFANSLVIFLVAYGFDGVDIDWEYPVACERGGVPSDKQNMVDMFQTVRSTFAASGHTFGLTFTAPSSYWYLQHFDLLGLLTYADWVNLMSYDLHGVWDAKDVFIGNIVQAHTNLTEIKQSINLFQRVGVPLDRIVLGLGFYGRSFQLSDVSCSVPGCPFNGPAPGGPCTAADGTLSFAEIQEVLSRSNATAVYDETAQVKYLVYDTDNWISYDDKDTFNAKLDFARGAGLGGVMVWSADQDDFEYVLPCRSCPLAIAHKSSPTGSATALSAVLGEDPTQIIPRSEDLNSRDGKQCVQPGCGRTCPSGYVQMTDVTDGKLGEPSMLENYVGVFAVLPQLHQRQTVPQALETLSVVPLTKFPRTVNGEEQVRFTPYPFGYLKAHHGPYIEVEYCDGVCLTGEITLAVDSWGTGRKCSSGHKAFCCESGLTADEISRGIDCQWCTLIHARQYGIAITQMTAARYRTRQQRRLSTAVRDLFPNPPEDGDMSWDLQDNPIDENAPNGGTDADDDSFGLIAMDGPSNLLSSVAPESGWVLVGCTGNTTGIQSVIAYCTTDQSEIGSPCTAVFEGDAKNTIIKLPSGCGGPYARLHEIGTNPTIRLPSTHAARKPGPNPVYDLQFDFEFARMSETRDVSDGSVLLRIDATTIPGYWAEIDTSDPNSPLRREFQRRWFGSFGDWLARLNKVKSKTQAALRMSKSFESVLYSASQSCASADGTTTFDSSISLTAQGSADYMVEYGFYLEGTIFPPDIDQAYIYVSSQGSATIGLEMAGRAQADYNSGQVAIIPPIYWPGLSYPGIVSVGPALNIYGQLRGAIAISGTIGATVAYPLPELHIALGITGNDSKQSNVDGTGLGLSIPTTFEVAPTFDVALSDLDITTMVSSIDAIPEASLTFNLLPNTPVHVNARAYIALDGGLSAFFENDGLSSVTAHVTAGVKAVAGVEASAGTSAQYTLGPFYLYQNTLDLYEQTIPLPGTSQHRRSLPYGSLVEDGIFGASEATLISEGTRASLSLTPSVEPPFTVLLGRRSLIDGTLLCPAVTDGGNTRCAQDLADDDPADADPDDTSDELSRRFIFMDDGHLNISKPAEDVKVPMCPGLSEHNNYGVLVPQQSAKSTGLVDLPLDVDLSILAYLSAYPNVKFAREHVYEIQLLTQFMSDVISTTFPSTSAYCAAIKQMIFKAVSLNTNAGSIRVQLSALLAATEPTGRDPMPMLFDVANSAKQAFISGRRRFHIPSKLRKKAPGNVIYLIRAAAASVEYMQSQEVQLTFSRIARAVESLWVDYYAYNALPKPPQFDVKMAYQEWVAHILGSYVANANQFFGDAIAVLDAALTANGDSIMIGVPMDCSPQKVKFDRDAFHTLTQALPTGTAAVGGGLGWTYPHAAGMLIALFDTGYTSTGTVLRVSLVVQTVLRGSHESPSSNAHLGPDFKAGSESIGTIWSGFDHRAYHASKIATMKSTTWAQATSRLHDNDQYCNQKRDTLALAGRSPTRYADSRVTPHWRTATCWSPLGRHIVMEDRLRLQLAA